MVRGLERFKTHFQGLDENYVLIGGTACSLLMDDAGLDFRVTMDLDIVLCLEALDVDFVKAFWEFVHLGEYSSRQKSTGEKRFYRFHSPKGLNYPKMLELFSRIPDALHYEGEGHLTPIPIEEEVSSLSAILMNVSYYEFLHAGKRVLDGIPIIGPEWIIPLKARAWLDLTSRKNGGEHIDSKNIRKHKNDIFRLYRIVMPNNSVSLPDQVGKDMIRFVAAMESDSIDLKTLGYQNVRVPEVLSGLKKMYGLPD